LLPVISREACGCGDRVGCFQPQAVGTADRHGNKEIADVLSISLKAVENHRASALRKLKLSSSADLVRYAIRNKLVEL
jgi:hypothetical protein